MAENPHYPVPETDSSAVATKPGDTIVPAGAPRSAEDRVTTLPTLSQPQSLAPQPEVAAVVVPEAPQPDPAPERVPMQPVAVPTGLNPVQPDEELLSTVSADADGAITWTASEFIAHEKTASWYGALAAIAIVAAAMIYLLTRDLISSIVVIVSALALGFYGSRQPRQLQYTINEHGIGIGAKFYPYDNFRSFAVVQDGTSTSIIFAPLKRFATLATIYYAPEDEDRIISILSDRLPFEEHTPDAVDRLMRRIRF